MAKCMYCDKKYRAYDDDAGTMKEHFCSTDCARDYERDLDAYLDQQENNDEE